MPFFFPTQRVALDAYWLVNATVSYKLQPGVEVFGRVENVLDQHYQEVFGFESAPIAAYAGLKLTFGGTDGIGQPRLGETRANGQRQRLRRRRWPALRSDAARRRWHCWAARRCPLAAERRCMRGGAAGPSRIVSLDLCTDQLLIELVDREPHRRRDASGRRSRRCRRSPRRRAGLPITRGAAEDVLRYDPDLVLAGPFGVVGDASTCCAGSGRRVVIVPLPQDLDGVRTAVRTVAAAVGERAAKARR